MQCSNLEEDRFSQLKAVLQSPVVQLDYKNQSTAFIEASHLLSNSNHCCIAVATSTSSNKLQNVKNLYRSAALLKDLRRRLSEEHSKLNTDLIGIYPSVDYPACVYELNTPADYYVSSRVMPVAGSPLARIFKRLISKVLGVNPAVGGLGLILYKD